MPGPLWNFTLASTSVANKPKITRTYSVDGPGTTEQGILQPAIQDFAPGAEILQCRTAANRDITVIFRILLQSLIENQPSDDMNPEWSTFTATLIVYGGVGRVNQTSLSQHAGPGSRNITTRGRNQAGGKPSSQGKNTDRLLSLTATKKLHKTCKLLLLRDSDASSNNPFLPYAEQSRSALAVLLRVVTLANNSSDSVVVKTLKR